MVEVETPEVDAIPAPVSLAQQWVKIDKYCWVTHECTDVEKRLLLEPIVEEQLDWMVPKGIIERHGLGF
jgi:hypothetical protein